MQTDHDGYVIRPDGWDAIKTHVQRNWADQIIWNGYLPDITTMRNTYDGGAVSRLQWPNVVSCPVLNPPPSHSASGTSFTNHEASSVTTYGIRGMHHAKYYPGEKLGMGRVARLQTIYKGAPFMADSVKLDYNGQPGQAGKLGFDKSDYNVNNAGNIYLAHENVVNCWFVDGHVEAITNGGLREMKRPNGGGGTPVHPIEAYPFLGF